MGYYKEQEEYFTGTSDGDKRWLDWLEYFYENSDFGPADDDVRYIMWENFKQERGVEV